MSYSIFGGVRRIIVTSLGDRRTNEMLGRGLLVDQHGETCQFLQGSRWGEQASFCFNGKKSAKETVKHIMFEVTLNDDGAQLYLAQAQDP